MWAPGVFWRENNVALTVSELPKETHARLWEGKHRNSLEIVFLHEREDGAGSSGWVSRGFKICHNVKTYLVGDN